MHRIVKEMLSQLDERITLNWTAYLDTFTAEYDDFKFVVYSQWERRGNAVSRYWYFHVDTDSGLIFDSAAYPQYGSLSPVPARIAAQHWLNKQRQKGNIL